MADENGKAKAGPEQSVEDRDEEFRPIDPDDPLDKYVIVRWPWGEAEDRWFEALTGEPCNDGKARDSDL
jgi:hypothetical protein